jgi:hypothetical protein
MNTADAVIDSGTNGHGDSKKRKEKSLDCARDDGE